MRAIGALLTFQQASRAAEEHAAIDALFPPVIQGWALLQRATDGAAYARRDGLKVICSVSDEQDGKRWLHVSCSRKARIPSYGDMVDVKSIFVGEHREAYQVFARSSKHVNIMPFCLHLWCCLDAPDGAVLPDFTQGGDSI